MDVCSGSWHTIRPQCMVLDVGWKLWRVRAIIPLFVAIIDRFPSVMTHVAVTTSDTMLVIDRKENNPLLKADGKPAWGAVWNLQSNTARPLNIVTHSFCSSGNLLSNGTRELSSNVLKEQH